MASPYTQPTLTGYNSSPPADDGSAVASNAVTWAKHIDKIGDPLKLYAQSINTNVAAAFGKMFGNNITTLATTTSVDATYQGKAIVATAAITLNLLAAATASTNFMLAVYNDNTANADVTIDGNASETINGATTLTLRPSEWCILICDGSNWRALVYSRATTPATQATTSGNAKDFTGIPAWVTQIVVNTVGVSTNGSTNVPLVQLGDSGGIETSGYLGTVHGGTGSALSSGFALVEGVAAGTILHGCITLTRHGTDGLTWAAFGIHTTSNATGYAVVAGTKALSAQLDRIRYTLTGTPTDSFDAGAVSIRYS